MTWEIVAEDGTVIDTIEDHDVTVLREGQGLQTVPLGRGEGTEHTARTDRDIRDRGDPLGIQLKDKGLPGLSNRQAAVWSEAAPLEVGDTRILLHRKGAIKVRIKVTAYRSAAPPFLLKVIEDVFGNLQQEPEKGDSEAK